MFIQEISYKGILKFRLVIYKNFKNRISFHLFFFRNGILQKMNCYLLLNIQEILNI